MFWLCVVCSRLTGACLDLALRVGLRIALLDGATKEWKDTREQEEQEKEEERIRLLQQSVAQTANEREIGEKLY